MVCCDFQKPKGHYANIPLQPYKVNISHISYYLPLHVSKWLFAFIKANEIHGKS